MPEPERSGERAVDTSVAVAAIVADHEAHEQAERVLSRSGTTIAHVAVETYGVLTRLPVPLRVGAASAAELVHARLPPTWLALDAAGHASAIAALGAARVGAGATYDGLIALTALAHGVLLVSRDRRAARTYRALGAAFELLD